MTGTTVGGLFVAACIAASAVEIPPAAEVTLRHEIYQDAVLTAYLLEIPPGIATQMHRHDKDILTVFLTGVSTTAVFEGAQPVVDAPPAGSVRYRTAGFAHSTKNNDAKAPFKAVVIEFRGSQGPREPTATPPALLCATRFCAEALEVPPGGVAAGRLGGVLVAVNEVSGRVDGKDFRRPAGAVWDNRAPWINTGSATARVIAVRPRN